MRRLHNFEPRFPSNRLRPLTGVAAASAGVRAQQVLEPSGAFRVVGLPMWPSIGALPNATLVINSSEVFYHDNSE